MLTYFDVVEHLISASFGGPQDAEQRDIRTAVHRCYAELSNIKDWSWQHVHGRVITVAPETGSVDSYSSGTLTLSSGLTGTGFTHVQKGQMVARIKSRTSSSVYVLDDDVQFPSLTSGDTVTFYKTLYPLPSDFRNLDEPSDEFNWWSGSYITPDEAMKMERVNNQTGAPLNWTVIKDPNGDGYVLKLIGYPTSVETVDFTYRRSLRSLRWSGHETAARAGTVASSGTSVTGSTTTLSSSMVGAVMRFGDTSNSPGPITSISPYVAESKVAAVGGATDATLSDSVTAAGGTKYLVTDPIDLPQHMHNCMLSGAEYWLARIRSSNVEEKYSLYQRDLRLAMESDQLAPLSGRSQQIWSDGGWRSPLLADNFNYA